MVRDCPCGFTFYIWGHLYVVIAELSESDEQVIVVNLTTKRTGSDETVILSEGDHPFVIHDTAINFQDARKFTKLDLLNRINQKFFEPGELFSADLIKIVQQGLLKSPHTPNDIKAACASIFDF